MKRRESLTPEMLQAMEQQKLHNQRKQKKEQNVPSLLQRMQTKVKKTIQVQTAEKGYLPFIEEESDSCDLDDTFRRV